MRMLYINPAYFPALGRAELHLNKVSEGLTSRGHEVSVLTVIVRNIWEMGTARDTVDSIIELLSDSEKYERMGRSGSVKTVAQLTWDRVADKVQKLCPELLAAKDANHPVARQIAS